jgi:dolichol kinase
LFGVILVAAEIWARAGNGKPEHTRKLVHLGGSAIGVFLPLLVESPLVAFVLTASLSLLFFVTSKGKLLRSVGGIARSSRGSEYYPLAVFLVFVLAAGDYWRYLASLLVLGVADAFAALVGGEYGRLRYTVEEESKSLEGSLVFLTVAFLAIMLPTLLLTDLPRPIVVLASLHVALVVTGFEAISLRGADNLFVPIATCVILGKITTKPITEIQFQVASLAGLSVIIGFGARRFPGLNVGATIAVLLFTYGLWSLGSPLWAAPVLIAMVALVVARSDRFSGNYIGVRPVARACMPLVAILIVANTYQQGNFWYAPFLGATAAMTAIGVVQAAGHRARAFPLAVGACLAIILIPAALARSSPTSSIVALFAVSLLGGAGALAMRRKYPAESRLGNFIPAITAILAAAVVASLEHFDLLPIWIIQLVPRFSEIQRAAA